MDWDELLATALRAGLSAPEFWALTPRETYLAVNAALEAEQRHVERLAWAVWHVAALQRCKHFPSFAKFYRKPPRRLTPAEVARKQADHKRLAGQYEAAQQEKTHE